MNEQKAFNSSIVMATDFKIWNSLVKMTIDPP